MTDERYAESLETARRTGIDIAFDIAPLEFADHPNAVRVAMGGRGGDLVLWARSVGGGAVEIYRMGNREIFVDGKAPAVIDDGGTLRRAEPVFFPEAGPPPFIDAAGMLDYAEVRGISLGRAALAYESAVLGKTEAEMAGEMLARYRIMRDSARAGMDPSRVRMPLLDPSAAAVAAAEREGALPIGGPGTRAAALAMAVMHTCNSRGIVCAAPTGGSAGVLPGAVMVLEELKGLGPEEVARCLFAAAAVGLVMARRATFAAETAGCQVEIGVAGAMAAAAVVEAVGGPARAALDAAAVSLQNSMGSVCDPVHGGCEIPCHTRNAVAASSAFVCADIVMGGYRNPIPLDETVDASFAVGKALPRELRCTALGGIAIAPSARAMKPRF